MKFHLLSLLLIASLSSLGQTNQSGGIYEDPDKPGPSDGSNSKILTKTELAAIETNMNFMLKRMKTRWAECTYMNSQPMDSFYDLYKALLYVKVVDNLRSQQLIIGPKQEQFKDCRPPLAAPEPTNKMNCLFQATEINFLTYIMNSESTYQIFQEIGKVPDDELKQVNEFFLDIILRSEQSAVRK